MFVVPKFIDIQAEKLVEIDEIYVDWVSVLLLDRSADSSYFYVPLWEIGGWHEKQKILSDSLLNTQWYVSKPSFWLLKWLSILRKSTVAHKVKLCLVNIEEWLFKLIYSTIIYTFW